MKLHYFIILSSILCFFDLKAQTIDLDPDKSGMDIIEQTTTKLVIKNTLSSFELLELKKDGKLFKSIRIPSYVTNHRIGYPDLLTKNQLIDIPFGCNIQINVLNKTEEIILLDQHGGLEIAPAQRSISKGEDADKVKLNYNKSVYQKDEFVGLDPVRVVELGKMRGHQLGRIEISPFDYNPVQGILKVITDIEFEVVFDQADLGLTNYMHNKNYSKDFNVHFTKLLNHNSFQTKDMLTTYPTKMVIVADPAFQAALQPLVEWKTKKGFTVIEAYTNDPAVGNTTTSIKNYLTGLYNAGTPSDPAPSYLLIVGDVAEVPSFNGTTGTHVSDLYYCEYDGGGDFYPELYYGRFSATNANQVSIMVDKTLEYEQYLFPNPSFLEHAIMISGVDASMAPTYGNGQINYGNFYYTNTAHNITSHTYLYPASGSSASQILQDANNGSCFINYTAHGYGGGWADPSFTCTDVYNMTNEHKLALMIGNCCQSNMFDDPECFGEALLRVQNKGAIGYIGGSNNTYWNEDYWWGVGAGTISANPVYSATDLGVYDRTWHDNGEPFSEWHVTNAQLMLGGNLAVTQAGGAEDYYYEIYHLMGDPSLMTYFGIPAQMNVSHMNAVPVGTASLTVVAEPDAYVAISMNGVLLDAQLTDASGTANLSFTGFSTLGTADLVVTKQNRQPYIGTVQVINVNAPFVAYDDHLTLDPTGNNNGLPDYDEVIDLDVTLSNFGLVDAFGVTAQLVCTNSYVNITDDNDTWGTINAASSETVNNAFSITIANDVPDQEIINYDIIVNDNSGGSWTSYFSMTANAPVLNTDEVVVDDQLNGNGNGRLEAGEVVDLSIPSMNDGHSDCINLNGNLSTNSTYVTITNPNHLFGAMLAGGNSNSDFEITVDPNTPYGTAVDFVYELMDGAYSTIYNFTLVVGIFSEDFESGDYSQFNWNAVGSFPWIIDQGTVYEGTHSSVSANIIDDQSSTMEIDVDVIATGDISFMKKVSSESSYDYLKFYIDNQLQGEWSGEENWSAETYSVSTGQHTFRWVYEKDYSVSDGMDAAWVDYILFPPMNSTVGIEENNSFNDLSIYPNPGNGQFVLDFESSENTNIIISVFDAKGALVVQKSQYVQSGLNQVSMDLKQPQGIYLLQIVGNGQSITREIVIQ